eukprot:6940664-Prymnesium_polylepis.1
MASHPRMHPADALRAAAPLPTPLHSHLAPRATLGPWDRPPLSAVRPRDPSRPFSSSAAP